MDHGVIRSMLKWPGIPDVYGWLQLDRRGNWRLRSESQDPERSSGTIGNVALREFISRNYAADERGCWYFQNGPQRVFVRLAFAPYVFHLADGGLVDHCGLPAGPLDGAWIDEEGSLVLRTAGRIGLLDDRELFGLAEQLSGGGVRIGSVTLPVGAIDSRAMEARFGFVKVPKP